MACCLFGTKPLSEPLLAYGWLDTWEQICKVIYWNEFYHPYITSEGPSSSLQCSRPSRQMCIMPSNWEFIICITIDIFLGYRGILQIYVFCIFWGGPLHRVSVNSLAPGRFPWNFRWLIFKPVFVIDGCGLSCDIVTLPWDECHRTLLMISQHWFR